MADKGNRSGNDNDRAEGRGPGVVSGLPTWTDFRIVGQEFVIEVRGSMRAEWAVVAEVGDDGTTVGRTWGPWDDAQNARAFALSLAEWIRRRGRLPMPGHESERVEDGKSAPADLGGGQRAREAIDVADGDRGSFWHGVNLSSLDDLTSKLGSALRVAEALEACDGLSLDSEDDRHRAALAIARALVEDRAATCVRVGLRAFVEGREPDNRERWIRSVAELCGLRAEVAR